MRHINLWLLSLCLLVVSACSTPADNQRRAAYRAKTAWQFTSASLSADGKKIVFGYQGFDERKSRWRIAMMDVETGAIRLFPQPQNLLWDSPVFSPDGKTIALTSTCFDECSAEEHGYHVATIDLQSGAFRLLNKDGRRAMLSRPTFSPDGKTIYVGATGIIWNSSGGTSSEDLSDLSAIRVADGQVTPVLPSAQSPTRFRFIDKATQLNDGRIVFIGSGPRGGEIAGRVASLPDGEWRLMAYQYDAAKGLRLIDPLAEYRLSNLTPSDDGKHMAFLSNSNDAKTVDMKAGDVYVLANDTVQKVTQIGSSVGEAVISRDGSAVVFFVDDDAQTHPGGVSHGMEVWSIWLHNVKTKETRKILTSEQMLAAAPQDNKPANAQ